MECYGGYERGTGERNQRREGVKVMGLMNIERMNVDRIPRSYGEVGKSKAVTKLK